MCLKHGKLTKKTNSKYDANIQKPTVVIIISSNMLNTTQFRMHYNNQKQHNNNNGNPTIVTKINPKTNTNKTNNIFL